MRNLRSKNATFVRGQSKPPLTAAYLKRRKRGDTLKKKHTTPAVVFHLDMIQPTSKKWVIAKGFDGMSYMNRDGKFLPKKRKHLSRRQQ